VEEIARAIDPAAFEDWSGALDPRDLETQQRRQDAARSAAARVVKALGLERRYYLAGHPGWPDPLMIWPPTEEVALATYERYPHPRARLLATWAAESKVLREPEQKED